MAEQIYSVPEMGPEKATPQKESLEIEELKQRLEKLESQLKKEQTPEKKGERVKQEIKSYLRELQQTPSFAPSPSTRDEAEEIAKFEPNQQVGSLISLVFEKGLPEAISVARDLNNPAILDEFHDALVDHYYQEMIERKILKF
ncbi:MAG: hypothetical protein COV00_00540 [Candidatus Tagabacteria bacterium CG10_big_fil_rev_8_21_14_0_10_40_13]|uniref:Uncharacterized protein n=1 Tax=Candidatus Tagabacteria bacterium CG10_big_fil_rev_8_21_14_0_10_40_13 TaxID=1975022 RepID=A0A2M8L9M0_9BACT|nr:MAG: hypothetical protein COV00_00540 [Candidatus Tagabacteria bacterium CG10_big_fil_rev_8_21_14_0_10_40_13]